MNSLARRTFLLMGAALSAATLFAQASVAETIPPDRRVALSGYDPVAYFTDGRPEKGSEDFWFAFDDAVYLFRNAEHRSMFVAEPERYAPQYAGWCAAGVSKGYKTEPDPEAWVIADGKLYVLMLKERVADFKRDTAAFVDKSETNWPRLRDPKIPSR